MPRQGNKRKKRRTQKDEVDEGEEALKKTPRCFVLKKGAVGDRVKDLVQDFREVMMPNNARKLRESKLNRVEDFMAVAGHFRVSHLVLFTATKSNTYMKLVKLPQGPTLTFKVDNFVLSRDVRAVQRRHRCSHSDWMVAPLQVLNGFGQGESNTAGARQLMSEMFRGFFPAVDVPNFKHADCRRVALFNYDTETDAIIFRHYTVAKKQNVGLQQGVSKLLRRRRFPRLGAQEDIADFVLGGGIGASASESEAEGRAMEAPAPNGGKVGIRLSEVGPRMSLQLIKAEDGVNTGTLLYHRYDMRAPSKQEVDEAKARQRKKLKARNQKLSEREKKKKVAAKKRKDEERKNAEVAEDRDPEENDGFIGKPKKTFGAEKLANSSKSKRSHPFAWGRKKAGGEGGEDAKADGDKPKKGGKGKGGGKSDGGDEESGGRKGRKGKGGGKSGGGDGEVGTRKSRKGKGKGKGGGKDDGKGKGKGKAGRGEKAGGKKRSADKVLGRFKQSASKRRK